MKTFLALLFNFITGIPITLLHGYVLHYCWAWFIVPKFGGPQLSIVESIGVIITVQTFLGTKWFSDAVLAQQKELIAKGDLEDDEFSKATFSFLMRFVAAALLLLGLGVAYAWKQFLP